MNKIRDIGSLFDTMVPEDQEAEVYAASVKNVLKSSPTKSEATKVKPKTVSDVMIPVTQPRAVTYASYDCTALQEDILTSIISELSRYQSAKASLVRPDLFGVLTIPLNIDDFPGLDRKVSDFRKAVREMRAIDFNFAWKYDFANTEVTRGMFLDPETGESLIPDGAEVETTGSVIINVHKITDSKRILVDLNPLVVPFLLYIGKQVGGTKYFKGISMSLSGKYTKRIYKMIMDWHTLGTEKRIPIQEFRDILQIPASYDNNKIRTDILEKARQEIEMSDSSVKFSFDLVNTGLIRAEGRKKPADTIIFKLSTSTSRAKQKAENDTKALHIYLADIAEKEVKHHVPIAVDAAKEQGVEQRLISKFTYYYHRLNAHEITKAQYVNTMLKIARELTGVDLRSPAHQQNALRSADKRSK